MEEVEDLVRATVSRVLNDEPYVSDEARRRVLAAAEELGYRLNHAARALASGRTRSIGVVALGTAGYGTASLLVHLEQAVRDAGYAPRVVNTPDGDPKRIAGAVESLHEQGVDGVVVSEPIVEGEVSVRVDVPVLFVGAPPASSTCACQLFTFQSAGSGAWTVRNARSGLNLDVRGSCVTAGAAVIQNTSSTAASQRWTPTDAGGGYFKLVNAGSGLAVGIAQSSTANGAAVIQWNDVTVDDQLWKIVRIN